MTLTKPAGVAFQILGGLFLVLAIMSLANGAVGGAVLFLPLGGWMMWAGGRRARQTVKKR